MTRAEKIMAGLLLPSLIVNVTLFLFLLTGPLPKHSDSAYEECMAGWKDSIADLNRTVALWNASTDRLNTIMSGTSSGTGVLLMSTTDSEHGSPYSHLPVLHCNDLPGGTLKPGQSCTAP